VNLRFNLDPSGDPHVWNHNVGEQEVAEAMGSQLESIRGRGTSLIVLGLTRAGRYLKVICSPDEIGDGIFIVTAFDLPPRQIKALKQRLKRRRT
jgi:hypothetical protein